MIAILSTGLLTALAGVFAFLAWQHGSRAANHEREAARIAAKLQLMRGEVIGNGEAVESTQKQLAKLRGQFYAFKAAVEDDPYPHIEARELPHNGGGMIGPAPASVCENYGKAQVEGPMSPAARCDCGYCTEMRRRRDEARDRLIPKTAAGQAAHARKASNNAE